MAEICLLTNVSGEQWAAWTQAVLSAGAIIASVLVVNHQHKLELQREAIADALRKRQHLESAFQLVGAVYQITQKAKRWSEVKPGEPDDPYDLVRMRFELEGLVDALRQTDFGRFDQHMPIEATLVALSAARQLRARLASAYISATEIGEMATDLGEQLKERLDKIHAAFPNFDGKP